MSSPEGRSILITGSTDGHGLALARSLAGDGAAVLVHGRDPREGRAGRRRGRGRRLVRRRPRLARRDPRARRRGLRRPRAPRCPGQQRRRRDDGAADQRGRVRARLRRQPPRALPAHARAAAAAEGGRAAADRQRLLDRPDGDRLRRRDARTRLGRRPRLLPVEAGADPVHPRARRAARRASDRERAPPGDLHGHEHGPRDGPDADQHRRRGHARRPGDSRSATTSRGSPGGSSTGRPSRGPTHRPTTPRRGGGSGSSAPGSPAPTVNGSTRSADTYNDPPQRAAEGSIGLGNRSHEAQGERCTEPARRVERSPLP